MHICTSLTKNTFLTFLIAIALSYNIGFSQNVGINSTGSAPNSSAMLDVSSTNSGLLIPRMTTTQMNAIVSPATSLMVYNTTTNCFYFYTGSAWQVIACTCTSPPSTPGSITGSVTVCATTSGVTYTISAVSGATSYTWTVPSGATITSGQGTTTITVTFGSTSGNVTVTASNSCGTSAASTLAVTVNSAPSAPGSITGSTSPAISSSGNVYSISAVTGATGYHWSINPSGATITAGQGTTSITVSFGATPTTYTICVYDSNSCGKSSTGPCLTVTSTSCTHGTVTFSYTGSIQTWTVPSCITSVTITVDGAQGGNSVDRLSTSHTGGLGGQATGTLTVVGGQTLYIYVGGQGSTAGTAGWNGGGAGGTSSAGGSCSGGPAAAGGDASDLRSGGTALANRVIVGGGGGGSGRDYCNGTCQPCGCGGSGGGGGGTTATTGAAAFNCGYGYPGTGVNGGGGGTGAAGGAGGTGDGGGANGTAGSSGNGGGGASGTYDVAGGGGGGGYYGGGGGGSASSGSGVGGGGGGGGSSYIGGVTGGSTTGNTWSGNGQVTITY